MLMYCFTCDGCQLGSSNPLLGLEARRWETEMMQVPHSASARALFLSRRPSHITVQNMIAYLCPYPQYRRTACT